MTRFKFSTWLALGLLSACGAVSAPDGGGVNADAGAARDAGGVVDAGVLDAGEPRATWANGIGASLRVWCGECHSLDAGQLNVPPFVDDRSLLLTRSSVCNRWVDAGATVAECVATMVQHQITEGTGCRTVVPEAFHREGWVCLSPSDVARVVGWVDAGVP